MKLLGLYRSPYVRRVAASLNLLGLPFEHEPVPVFEEPEKIRAHNPLTRIPTLILDDGEVLVESYAILDTLEEMAKPEKRLVPASGSARRAVMKMTAVATGTMDKAVWAVYEGRFHPKEKIHGPWIEHNDNQVLGGLEFLDEAAKQAGDGWIAGTDTISQADVSATIAYSFSAMARPKLGVDEKFPNLAAFAARQEATEAFSSVKP